MSDPSLTDRIGPKRTELFREILQAWASTAADERQPIEARAMAGNFLLLHPGFGGRDVKAQPKDIAALVAEDLLTQSVTGTRGDRRIEPSRRVIEALRARQESAEPKRPIGFETSTNT